MSELILVRHGETAGESSIRYYGSTDIPLSDAGRMQMKLAGEALRDICFRTVVTSPLSRSMEGASIVLGGANGVTTVVVEAFREIDFGDWEGLTAREIESRFPETYREWREHGRLEAFPGGDSRAGFTQRVMEAAGTVFEDIELPALAVLHKGVIRSILFRMLGEEARTLIGDRIELGSIHRLRRNGTGWTLAAVNETVHLGDYRMEHS